MKKKRKNHKRNPKENASRVAGALIIPHLPRQERRTRTRTVIIRKSTAVMLSNCSPH
jgi:hypothetical protein